MLRCEIELPHFYYYCQLLWGWLYNEWLPNSGLHLKSVSCVACHSPNAERAVETGIAARSYSDDELLDQALSKAREIAQWPVNSLREIKATLRLPHKAHIDAAFKAEQAGMERQAGSPENIEAITAFMEKRPAKFR